MTYKAPPPEPDDERREYREHTYPVRRRSSARSAINRAPERPAVGYRTGEGAINRAPTEPKVRRASLGLDQQHTERPSKPDLEEETEKSASTGGLVATGRSSSKILVTPNQRRSPIYVPSSSMQESRHLPSTRATHVRTRATTRYVRSHRPLLQQLSQLRHNQAVLIIGILALIVLVIVPIIVNISRSYTTVTPSSTSGTTDQPNAGFQQVPLSAHELIIIPQDTDHPAPPVLATSAYLLDADSGVTLYAYNPFMHLPMLSTTKLMTAALVVQQGNLDQKITINNAMEHDIGQLSADSALFGVKKGETYTLRDMLYGLLFVSGNDAAIVIADALAGNMHNFVAEMNQQAQKLGLYDTHFMNPHGLLQAGQYSSAHDLALLGKYSLGLPVLHKMSSETVYPIAQGGNHPARVLINENQFLWWYPGVDGGKTGYDGQSDFIQVISVTRNHHHLIGVVMHTNDWWTDMRDLMNWGFDSFNWISPHDVDSPSKPIPFDNLWNFFARDKKENTILTADGGRYYIYTGFSISGPIMSYFDKHGGLKAFGYPIKLPVVSSGPSISQQFEHAAIQCDLTTNSCQTS